MASLPVSGLRERNGSKTNLARSKIGASTLNLTGRASNITPATAARTLAGSKSQLIFFTPLILPNSVLILGISTAFRKLVRETVLNQGLSWDI